MSAPSEKAETDSTACTCPLQNHPGPFPRTCQKVPLPQTRARSTPKLPDRILPLPRLAAPPTCEEGMSGAHVHAAAAAAQGPHAARPLQAAVRQEQAPWAPAAHGGHQAGTAPAGRQPGRTAGEAVVAEGVVARAALPLPFPLPFALPLAFPLCGCGVLLGGASGGAARLAGGPGLESSARGGSWAGGGLGRW